MSDELNSKVLEAAMLAAATEAAKTGVTNAVAPVTEEAGTTFRDLWFIGLGWTTYLADKLRVKYDIGLQLFKKECFARLEAIPEDKRVDPDTHVILNALVDAQTCVEEATLRKMFADLIASAMNSDLAKSVHPSFSGIIRQMTSLDAKNLILIHENQFMPIVRLILEDTEKNRFISDIVFIGDSEGISNDPQGVSIDNLVSLGLVSIDFSMPLFDDSKYLQFFQTPQYMALDGIVKENPERNYQLSVERGSVKLTKKGKFFVKTCCLQLITPSDSTD